MIENKRLYAAILHKDADSDFGVSIPDLPGCYASGNTVEEALRMAYEAAAIMVEELIKDKQDIPLATAVEDLGAEDTEGAYMVSLVNVILPSRAKRVQVTIDEAVLEAIDAVSGNRSKFLTDAARTALFHNVRR